MKRKSIDWVKLAREAKRDARVIARKDAAVARRERTKADRKLIARNAAYAQLGYAIDRDGCLRRADGTLVGAHDRTGWARIRGAGGWSHRR